MGGLTLGLTNYVISSHAYIWYVLDGAPGGAPCPLYYSLVFAGIHAVLFVVYAHNQGEQIEPKMTQKGAVLISPQLDQSGIDGTETRSL